jgi:hypothetical protein
MEFSIFGVRFGCAKNMFSWEKIKWSFFVYWAQLWRSSALVAVAFLVGFVLLLTPAFLNSNALSQFNNSEFDVKISMHVAYSLHYWYQQLLTLGIAVLCFWFFGLILAGLYVQYYVTFKKNYRSFSRQFNKPEVKSFWCWGFWKPFILTLALGLLFGWGSSFVLGLLGVHQSIVSLIGFIVGAAPFHIFIHGGTWGFVPVRKSTKAGEVLTAAN